MTHFMIIDSHVHFCPTRITAAVGGLASDRSDPGVRRHVGGNHTHAVNPHRYGEALVVAAKALPCRTNESIAQCPAIGSARLGLCTRSSRVEDNYFTSATTASRIQAPSVVSRSVVRDPRVLTS